LLTLVAAVAEFFVVVAVALAAVLLKTIDGRGFLASALVGFAIIYGGGVPWFLLVAVFFILGVTFTLYEYGYKKKLGGAQEKGGARNWPNILANGGAGSVISIFNFFSPSATFAVLFLGAISASAADTAATELGLLSKRQPRLITNPSKVVRPGTSGGVSTLGFAGAILASGVIGVMGFFFGILGSWPLTVSICLVSGTVGAVADSLIGAAVQRKGFCAICLKPTESLRHCGESTKKTGGTAFIENNAVNLIATVAGALAAVGLFLALSQ